MRHFPSVPLPSVGELCLSLASNFACVFVCLFLKSIPEKLPHLHKVTSSSIIMSKDADPAADPAEEDSSDKSPLRLSQEMRVATREAHSLSDHLVNLKLGVALSDDAVWAEGLLVFYEVFRFLELAAERRADSLLGELRVPGLMDRTKAFEKDLRFYLGEGWNGKDYEVRPQVAAYLKHLQGLEEVEPYLLIAYFYHLYMGLLSGGQVLRGKRRLLRKVPLMGKDENGGSDDNGSEANPGEAVVHFTRPIPVLKKEMREVGKEHGDCS